MLQLIHVATLDHPALGPYRTMRDQTGHFSEGIFVAEGHKVVRRLLESPLEVLSLCLPDKRLPELAPLIERRPESIPTYIAPKEQLELITGYPVYQGVMAVGRVPPFSSIDQILKSPRPYLFTAIEGLTNAENIGTVVRNGAAMGVQAVLVGPTSGSPYLRRAVRSSMGTIFKMPVVECKLLEGDLAALKRHGVRLVAAHPRSNGNLLGDVSLRDSCCIILGSEGAGLPEHLLNVCDDFVAIPMCNAVDSLNVGSAAAAFFFEAQRQRRETASGPKPL